MKKIIFLIPFLFFSQDESKMIKFNLDSNCFKIEEEWVLLNDNSSKNFIKISGDRYPTDFYLWDNKSQQKIFKFFKDLDELDNEEGGFFTGTCYYYNQQYNFKYLEESLEDGVVDEKKIFNDWRKGGNGSVYVYKVEKGQCIDFKEYKVDYTLKKCFLFKHIINSLLSIKPDFTISLKTEEREYEFIASYSNKYKKHYPYYYLKELQFYKICDHPNSNGTYYSEKHGLYRRWNVVNHNISDLNRGYYLAEEQNFINGDLHGFSKEWKAKVDCVTCYNVKDCYQHKYKLEDCKYFFHPPKLTFKGSFFRGTKTGKHIFWNYQGENGRHHMFGKWFRENNSSNSEYKDSLTYVSKVENYHPSVNKGGYGDGGKENAYFSLNEGLFYNISSSGSNENFYVLEEYDENTHGSYYSSNKRESAIHDGVIMQSYLKWEKDYFDIDRKEIKEEKIYGFIKDSWGEDLVHGLIEKKEYWKKNKLKKHLIYLKDNILEKQKCYNKKGERIQCQ